MGAAATGTAAMGATAMGAAATGAATGTTATGATATGVATVAGCWTVVPQGAPRLQILLHVLQLMEGVVITTTTNRLSIFFEDMLSIRITM